MRVVLNVSQSNDVTDFWFMSVLIWVKVVIISVPAISTVASITNITWSSDASKETSQESWWLTLLFDIVLCRIRHSLPHFTIWHKLC